MQDLISSTLWAQLSAVIHVPERGTGQRLPASLSCTLRRTKYESTRDPVADAEEWLGALRFDFRCCGRATASAHSALFARWRTPSTLCIPRRRERSTQAHRVASQLRRGCLGHAAVGRIVSPRISSALVESSGIRGQTHALAWAKFTSLRKRAQAPRETGESRGSPFSAVPIPSIAQKSSRRRHGDSGGAR